MPPHGTGGSWKKNDLVFRRIGRLKSKTLPTWSIWSYHQHTQLEAKFNRKMKQHQCVQFDFCRIFTGKNYPNPCPNPTSLLKSLVYLWVFFLKPTQKTQQNHPNSSFSFEATKRSLDGFHNIIVLGRLRQTAGQVHHGDVRCGNAEGHTGERSNEKGHDGWSGGWDLPGEINKWWFKMVQFETQAGKWYNQLDLFFLWDFWEVKFIMLNSRHFVNDPCHASLKGNWGFVAEGLQKLWSP